MSVSEDELLEHIAAAPEDPTPRSVYLDWLADRGDPRGTGGRSRGPLPELPGTARGLVARPAWLGGLRAVAQVKDCRFVDGVLETLALRADADSGAVNDPRLATVRELVIAPGKAAQAVWASGRLRSLTRLTGSVRALRELGPSGPRRLERVRVLVDAEEDWGAALAQLPPPKQLLLTFTAGRLSEHNAVALENLVHVLDPRRRAPEVGVEASDATTEGITAWLRFASERDAAYFVVQGKNLFHLDARARALKVSPYLQGKGLVHRLLTVTVLLRNLVDVPLTTVEIDGPYRLPRTFKGKGGLVLECQRRGDVTSLCIGGNQELP